MVSNLQSGQLSAGLCRGQGSLLLGGLFCYLITLNATMACHPAEANTCALVAQCPEEVHDMTNERVFRIFALNRQQARHWVRVEYNIVLYRVHVPIIVQCQGNGCSLSSKDGAVVRDGGNFVLISMWSGYSKDVNCHLGHLLSICYMQTCAWISVLHLYADTLRLVCLKSYLPFIKPSGSASMFHLGKTSSIRWLMIALLSSLGHQLCHWLYEINGSLIITKRTILVISVSSNRICKYMCILMYVCMFVYGWMCYNIYWGETHAMFIPGSQYRYWTDGYWHYGRAIYNCISAISYICIQRVVECQRAN